MPCEFRLQACYVHIGVMRRKEDKILVIVKCVDMSQNFTLSRTLFFFWQNIFLQLYLAFTWTRKLRVFQIVTKSSFALLKLHLRRY